MSGTLCNGHGGFLDQTFYDFLPSFVVAVGVVVVLNEPI